MREGSKRVSQEVDRPGGGMKVLSVVCIVQENKEIIVYDRKERRC